MAKYKPTRQLTTVEVFNEYYCDMDFFKLVERIKAEVPEIFHKDLKIRSKGDYGEDSDASSLIIYYDRPETDLEFKTREERIAQSKAQREMHQHQEYLRLKAIFEAGGEKKDA